MFLDVVHFAIYREWQTHDISRVTDAATPVFQEPPTVLNRLDKSEVPPKRKPGLKTTQAGAPAPPFITPPTLPQAGKQTAENRGFSAGTANPGGVMNTEQATNDAPVAMAMPARRNQGGERLRRPRDATDVIAG
jgi:hypothetical protein